MKQRVKYVVPADTGEVILDKYGRYRARVTLPDGTRVEGPVTYLRSNARDSLPAVRAKARAQLRRQRRWWNR